MHGLMGKIIKLLLNKKEPGPEEYIEPYLCVSVCVCAHAHACMLGGGGLGFLGNEHKKPEGQEEVGGEDGGTGVLSLLYCIVFCSVLHSVLYCILYCIKKGIFFFTACTSLA